MLTDLKYRVLNVIIFTLNQRKKKLNFEYQNRFLILFFVFRYSDSDIFSSYHAHIYLGETSPFYLLILDVIDWFMFGHRLHIYYICGPGCEKTGLRGFRPGPTQTGLYNNRRWLEA